MEINPDHKKITVTDVEVSVYAHATEDERRVEEAVMNMIPIEARESVLKIRKMTGHHGDPILLMTMRIKNRKKAKVVFHNLVRLMAATEHFSPIEDTGDRVDEKGNLYMRFDKQLAYRGRVKLNNVDPIRMKFRFRIPHGLNPARAVEDYIAGAIKEIGKEI